MADKVLNINPANMPVDHRAILQEWLFETSPVPLTKVVGEETVPIESPSEVTAAHVEGYLERHIKTEVRTYRRQKSIKDYESSYADIELESNP